MKKLLLILLVVVVASALVGIASPGVREEIRWRWAASNSSVPLLEKYLRRYPSGHYASEAKRSIEILDWEQAREGNTVVSFRDYLVRHPAGRRASAARTEIRRLRNDSSMYEAACQEGTIGAFETFLSRYPGHIQETAARSAIQDMEGKPISDLLDEWKIEVRAQGKGIEAVHVEVRRKVEYTVNVRIPLGTFFISRNPSAQNMVTRHEAKLRLYDDEWSAVDVEASCANMSRDVPGEGDFFSVRDSPSRKELEKLLPVMDAANVDSATEQAAIWIITDNADYDGLGRLVSGGFGGIGGSRTINVQEAAMAMRIIANSGIDIRRKAIWSDRRKIAKDLGDADLQAWLSR